MREKAHTQISVLFSIASVVLCFVLVRTSAFAQSGWHQETLPSLEPGSVFHLNDIKARSAGEVWVAGGIAPSSEAVVIKTLDGMNWVLAFRKGTDANPFASMFEFTRMSVVDGNTAWAGGTFGLTAFSTDGGQTWSREANACNPSTVGGPPMHVYGVKALSLSNVWMSGWVSDQLSGSIWHRPYSGDCGAWGYYPYRLEFQTGYSNMFGIDAADAGNAWAVYSGTGNGIARTTNGGDNWTSFPSPIGQLNDVAAVSGDVAWIVSTDGRIAKTTDGGATWQVQGSGTVQSLNKIAAVNTLVAWVAGNNGTIIKTTDGGSTWHLQVSGTTENLSRITAADANNAWAIGDNQTLLHVTDGGQNQVLPPPVLESNVTPPAGDASGGSQVVFNGANLMPGIQITFGGTPAASVQYISSSFLTVYTAPHPPGIVDIAVRNPDGQTARLKAAYAYGGADPIIMLLYPQQTLVNSSTTGMYVYGTGLSASSAIQFNGVPLATAYNDLGGNYGELSAAIPSSSLTNAGTASVTVVDGAKTSNALPFGINYALTAFSKPNPSPGTRIVPVQTLAGPATVQFNNLSTDGYLQVDVTPTSPTGYPPAGLSFMRHHYFDAVIHNASYVGFASARVCLPYAHADLAADGLAEAHLRLLYSGDGYYPWQDVTDSLDTSANIVCGTVEKSYLTQSTTFALGAPAIRRLPVVNYDEDAKTDITVWRPGTGIWYKLSSLSPGDYAFVQWGVADDVPVPGDYDGDGTGDVAVWRPGTGIWYVLPSESPESYSEYQWGVSTDIPVPGDYDGDGQTDIAVWRPETGIWYILASSSPEPCTAIQWGISTDIPVPADYDGDGKTDIAVWRPDAGVWYVASSITPGSYTSTQWGLPGDTVVPGDYDGDGKTDIAVWRSDSGVWHILSSSAPGTYGATQWGTQYDVLTPGDYDGDGKTDISVWRPDSGVWYTLLSSMPGSYTSTQWGVATDRPIHQ